jgi:gamma-glutamyltranspeptidase/glutathione hydrolase
VWLIGLMLVISGCSVPWLSDDGSGPVPVASNGAVEAAAPPQPEPEPAAGPALQSKSVAEASRYMVAAANPLAADAGLQILRAGGNAIDAAIAVQMVLTLVEPQSSGIGGGGFLLYHAAAGGALDAYDGRETAPVTATPNMFLRPDGKPMDFYEAVVGGLSVGTPGVLRMLELAHRDHGRLPWANLFEPAIRLADQGFEVTPRLNRLIKDEEYLGASANALAYFYEPDGSPLAVGSRLRNPELAATLRAIAQGGADAFYTGPIAADIVATVEHAATQPGRLTLADLAGYHAEKRTPVCLVYRVWNVCGMPPPSSGGIATLQILGFLAGYNMAAIEPNSPTAVHLIAEASRLAYADRNRYVGDPAFVAVPTAELLASDYLRKRARLIDPAHSMGEAAPGDVAVATAWATPLPQLEPLSTTHMSIVDGEGNAVSFTSSIEDAFGSRLMVRGFMLNNQLTDFSFQPMDGARPVANRVEPGKRPRSSMSPTIVLDRAGKPLLVVGSPGGASIIGYVVKTIVAALDWSMDPQAAVDLPNFVNRNGPTLLEQGTVLEKIAPSLEALGQEVKVQALKSGLQAIVATPDGLLGGADSRREGVAVGD